jgi:hypothetical protein
MLFIKGECLETGKEIQIFAADMFRCEEMFGRRAVKKETAMFYSEEKNIWQNYDDTFNDLQYNLSKIGVKLYPCTVMLPGKEE